MKAKNHIIYGDEATLRRLKSDYDFIGRTCEIQGVPDGGLRLVVFALPPRKNNKKKDEKRGGQRRGR